MKINILGKEYVLAYSLRWFLAYEGITGKIFDGKLLTEWITLLYSALLCADSTFHLSFDELIAELDRSDPQTLKKFIDFYTSEVAKRELSESKKKGLKTVKG